MRVKGISRDWLSCRLKSDNWYARAWFFGLGERHGFDVEGCTPPVRTGYKNGLRAKQPESSGSLTLWFDNPASPDFVYFQGTGQSAPGAYRMAREADGVEVNRIDVALDFDATDRQFNQLVARVKRVCRDTNRRFQLIDSDTGQTLYVNRSNRPEGLKTGNEKLPLMCARLYDKGREQGLVGSIWRRFEIEYRPDKAESKAKAFELSENELFGLRSWVIEICDMIGYDRIQRPEMTRARKSDKVVEVDQVVAKKMRTLGHMSAQYRKAAQELAELLGDNGQDRVMELIRAAMFDGHGVSERRLQNEADRIRLDQFWTDYTRLN